MPIPVRIIKVDPVKKRIVQMPLVPSIRGIRELLKAASNQVGWRKLIEDVHGEHLFVACRVELDPEKKQPEWRIRGGENTAGVGILFGSLNKATDGMWHCPVTVAWLERNIVWCEPDEVASAEEIANPERTPFEGLH